MIQLLKLILALLLLAASRAYSICDWMSGCVDGCLCVITFLPLCDKLFRNAVKYETDLLLNTLV